MISYISNKKQGPITAVWKSNTKKQFEKYIENNDWEYNFNDEERHSSCDCEASYLSQMIFATLFYEDKFEVKISNVRHMTIQGYEFHFDIMNNPNFKNSKNNKQNRIGAIASNFIGCNELMNIWKKHYHNIGNFAPIPWMNVKKVNAKNMQNLHEAKFYERWDLLLKYLQKNWDNKEIKFTFNDYMISTCQIIYYKKVLRDYKENQNTITDIAKWYKDQSKKCKNEEYDIINFNDESDEFRIDDEKIKEAIENINLLIEIRVKIILGILLNIKNENDLDKINFF